MLQVYSNDSRRQAICHPTDMTEYKDGYKSFPSGHVSCTHPVPSFKDRIYPYSLPFKSLYKEYDCSDLYYVKQHPMLLTHLSRIIQDQLSALRFSNV